jgi:WXG100 family type VII secretion target
MAGDMINVSFGAISSLASGIDGQVHAIEGQLDDLRSAIQKLAAQWEGSGADAFQAVQKKWDTSATDLTNVLNRIAVAVHSANDSYQQTENKNASSWG